MNERQARAIANAAVTVLVGVALYAIARSRDRREAAWRLARAAFVPPLAATIIDETRQFIRRRPEPLAASSYNQGRADERRVGGPSV
jgi:hypothetical protein